MKIIIAGGRDFDDYNRLCKILEKMPRNVEIISGTAKGADSLGARYARENNIRLIEFPADWNNLDVVPCRVKRGKYGEYNALAGHNWNKQMAEYGTHLIAFHDGKSTGTANMIGLAKKLGLTVKVFYY